MNISIFLTKIFNQAHFHQLYIKLHFKITNYLKLFLILFSNVL